MRLILNQKNLLLIILFSLVSIKTKATQQYPVLKDTLSIKVRTGTVRYSFNIYKSGKIIKIVYSYFNLFPVAKILEYPGYDRLSDEIKNANNDIKKRDSLIKERGKLVAFYNQPQRDSISLNIKTDTAYSHLIEQVSLASKEELEMDKNPPKKGTYRLVLDGSSVSLKKMGPSGIMEIYFHSPKPDSYPLICKLLTQTAKLCRERKNNSLLDNFGY